MCWHATAKAGRQKRRFQPVPRPPQRRRLLQRGSAGALRPRNQLVARAPRRPSASRSLPWQTARRSRKSRLHAGGRARTMSAASLPGTSELAASNCATGSSTTRSRRRRSNALRSDISAMNRRVLRSRNRLSRFRCRPWRGHPLLSPAKGRTQKTRCARRDVSQR